VCYGSLARHVEYEGAAAPAFPPDHHPLAMTEPDNTTETWGSAWPDALAFVVWLAVAWYLRWTATDLVWSLWLSSLVVGYALIVWTIFRPGVEIALAFWRARAMAVQSPEQSNPKAMIGMGLLMLLGALFILAFFTLHFGGFHYVHSQFLIGFFPLDGGTGFSHGSANMSTYLEVMRRYWGFLPMAFVAERSNFMKKALGEKVDLSVTVAAIAARKAANAKKPGGALMAPYRNVVRMHLLIFFFAFAHFAGVENFGIYAVVYTVYFFPWRLVRRSGPETPAALVPNG